MPTRNSKSLLYSLNTMVRLIPKEQQLLKEEGIKRKMVILTNIIAL